MHAGYGTRNLTQGDPMKLILGFSVPVVLGILCQQMSSFVDTAIVGRFLGAEALAAVGSTGAVNFLVIGFCTGICSGFGIPIAQSFGAENRQDLRRYTVNGCYLAMGIALLFAAAGALLSREVLSLMNTPAEIMDTAAAYIRIIFAGIPVTVLYNYAGCVLRSVGDSRTPVRFVILASVINIGLDLFFILVLRLGAAGAAAATVLSQLIAGVGCVATLLRHLPMLLEERDDLRPRGRYLSGLFAMGVPMGLQFSITAVGSIVMQTAVNGLGTAAVAAVTAASKVHGFFGCVLEGFGTCMATYCGQNIGAGKRERIPMGIRAASVIGAVYSAAVALVCLFAGKNILGLFLDGSANGEICALARQYLLFSAAFLIPLMFIFIFRLSIQGMGYTRLAMLAGAFEMVARMGVALLAVPRWGFDAACFSNPAAWVLADLFLIPAFMHAYRKTAEKQGLTGAAARPSEEKRLSRPDTKKKAPAAARS